MGDTVKTRRTYYEVLGLEPTATAQEIEQAFAGAIGIFRPRGFGGVAAATVAYQTLRDPSRRRAYDASLGLNSQPEPRPSPMTWRIGSQFISASTMPAMPPAFSRPAPPEPPAEPPAVPFIAASLRDLASPEPLRERLEARAKPQSEPAREPAAELSQAPKLAADRRIHLALDDRADGPDAGATSWKRAGMVLGGLAATAALVGAWAGWDSVGSAEPVQNEAKAVLPPPTTYSVGDPTAAAPDRVLDEARPRPPKRISRAAPRGERKRAPSRLAGLEQQLAETGPTPAETPAAPAADVAPAATAASMPLSNGTIARTIARIGYPCGSVASTSQILGKAFTVTCTSGHKYRAAPVRGRYHFRRLSGG